MRRVCVNLVVVCGLVTALAAGLPPARALGGAEGSTWYVDWQADGANVGTSWEDAFTDLQPALQEAAAGDQVWVAAGTYYPSVEVGGSGERYKTFQMKTGVAIYGGFPPGGGDRDPAANETILSGDVGVPGNSADNSYHVLYHPAGTDLDGTAVLDGFTVTKGNADGTGDHDSGGGIFNSGSSPALANCTFGNNQAGDDNGPAGYGAGMYNENSSPALVHCSFVGNYAGEPGYGGGMYNLNSSPALTQCSFSDNMVGWNSHGGGAGMYNNASSPALTDCTFSANSASGWEASQGGGMYNRNSSPTLTRCAFRGNRIGGEGGGMFNSWSSPTLTDCTFQENGAYPYSFYQGWGGGMYNYHSSPVVINSAFVGNWAYMWGGAVNDVASSPTFTNCVFTGNTVDEVEVGAWNSDGAGTATNTVFWGDTPPEIAGDAVVTYSDIQGGYAGAGNVDADPLWADPGNGDLHLTAGSPCIDAGSNDAPNLPPLDYEGDNRILDGDDDGTAVADMGVDEAPSSNLYVDWEAAGGDDGTSWEDAFVDLQDALEIADPGEQIWVAAGTYYPSVEVGGSGERYKTFQMKTGVAIYGGFDPSAGDTGWEDRDPAANETILSGDVGVPGSWGDNSYHVFYHPAGTNLDGTAVLDGFTVTKGNADGTGDHDSGAGIFNVSSSPALANCTFEVNQAGGEDWETGYGAGMYNEDSSPALTQCTFEDNQAGYGEWSDGYGGGMYNVNSSPALTQCTFSGNVVGWESGNGYGGGMYNKNSSPVLTDCTFHDNWAGFWENGEGGGIYNEGSSPILTRCTFLGNHGNGSGGGMQNSYSSPVLADCVFEGNRAHGYGLDFGGWGGGMANYHSSPTLTNCVFRGNWAYADGGGMYNWQDSSPVLTNCTFSGNHAWGWDGGGIFGGSPVVTNCILWGDAPDELYGGSPTVTYSDVQGGYAGTGNIDADPLWVDPANGDLHLTADSPCIDAGTNGAPSLPPYDYEGDPRILDGDHDCQAVADMGVDEAAAKGMHVGGIEGYLSQDPYGRKLLRMYVLVQDQAGEPLADVAVTASIWSPTGGPYVRTRMTRYRDGTARFVWGCQVSGTWMLCVDDLAREGYTYEPCGNVATCQEWMGP